MLLNDDAATQSFHLDHVYNFGVMMVTLDQIDLLYHWLLTIMKFYTQIFYLLICLRSQNVEESTFTVKRAEEDEHFDMP